MKPLLLALAGSGIAAALLAFWLAGGPPSGLPAAAGGQVLALRAGSVPQDRARVTTPPGAARTTLDSAGEADSFLEAGLRHRLEDLLLEAGEAATPAALKQRLAGLVPRFFPPADAARAQALLERYVDYRVALGALKPPADPGDPRALRAAIEARQRIREQHFAGEEYQVLFAQEEALDRYTLARLEIERNTGLSKEQKADALRDAEYDLGPSQRAARADAVAHLVVAQQSAAFVARGVDERERYAQRAAQYGQAAAQQLAQLDRQEQDWQRRLDDYVGAQARKLPPAELQQLRQQLFSNEEQLRIEAALALRALPPPAIPAR